MHQPTFSKGMFKPLTAKQFGQECIMKIKKNGSPLTEDRKAPGRNRTDNKNRVSSAQLLGNLGRIIIEHNGEEYVLRLTRSGKLILTK